jgi:uncharacterized protein YjbJ (UPF0337 family)
MDWDQLEGQWSLVAMSAQARWRKLTMEDWKLVDGKREHLVNRIQERYGILRVDAEAQADEWSKRFRGSQRHTSS